MCLVGVLRGCWGACPRAVAPDDAPGAARRRGCLAPRPADGSCAGCALIMLLHCRAGAAPLSGAAPSRGGGSCGSVGHRPPRPRPPDTPPPLSRSRSTALPHCCDRRGIHLTVCGQRDAACAHPLPPDGRRQWCRRRPRRVHCCLEAAEAAADAATRHMRESCRRAAGANEVSGGNGSAGGCDTAARARCDGRRQ